LQSENPESRSRRTHACISWHWWKTRDTFAAAIGWKRIARFSKKPAIDWSSDLGPTQHRGGFGWGVNFGRPIWSSINDDCFRAGNCSCSGGGRAFSSLISTTRFFYAIPMQSKDGTPAGGNAGLRPRYAPLISSWRATPSCETRPLVGRALAASN
jgi:hypothetical protein